MTIPMQREAVFSRGGSYAFIVQHDCLLHKEASEATLTIVKKWISQKKAPIRLLDLACGGSPIITADIMANLSTYSFQYLGIDVNEDQIAHAQGFPFSDNVSFHFEVGDAWNLSKLTTPFDIIFEGLNTHHATPEELHYIAPQLYSLLKPGGLFINYDLFRPAIYPYLHRPDHNGQESLRLVPLPTLEAAGIKETSYPAVPDWRSHFLDVFVPLLHQEGMESKLITASAAHIRERDYPVSTSEMGATLKSAGFNITVQTFEKSKGITKDYLGLVIAQKPN